MNYRKQFVVEPGAQVRLKRLDPAFRHGSKRAAERKVRKLQERMDELQFRLYAERKRSLLICLQALDAGGKDGVVRHVIGALNPQGCGVVAFKEPSVEEQAHDFLWRIERELPRRGEIVVFNRSHYEGVLVERVHHIVPRSAWAGRYDQINDFERRLTANGTHVFKFFLHLSKAEQLSRFEKRLDDPRRQWKIAEADYREREHWDAYERAYEDALSRCSTEHAPWFVIPSNHKWFRNLAISAILCEAMEDLNIQRPKPTVDLAKIRRKYHDAAGKT